jgi:hypothetical protein
MRSLPILRQEIEIQRVGSLVKTLHNARMMAAVKTVSVALHNMKMVFSDKP